MWHIQDKIYRGHNSCGAVLLESLALQYKPSGNRCLMSTFENTRHRKFNILSMKPLHTAGF